MNPDHIGFKIPEDLDIPINYQRVRDLMDSEGKQWDLGIISNIFPLNIRKQILNTPILEREQETLVWTPSTSGVSLVRSAHKLIIQESQQLTP